MVNENITGAADEKANENTEKIKNCIKIIEFIFTKINLEQSILSDFDIFHLYISIIPPNFEIVASFFFFCNRTVG